MSLLFIVLIWQVASRYVLNDPSTVTEELARLMLMAMGLTGAVLCFFQKKHLSLDLFLHSANPKTRIWLEIFSSLAIITLGFLLLVGGILMIIEKWSLGQQSSVLGFQLVWMYFLVPLSGILIMLSPFYNTEENKCN